MSNGSTSRRRSRLTPKHRVLKRWPDAYAYHWAGPQGWVIYCGEAANLNLVLGAGSTAALAWADAKINGRRR